MRAASLTRCGDLRLGRAGELQAEAHVGGNVHVRVERIGLEHHGDLALGGRKVVHLAAADGDRARTVTGSSPAIDAQQRGLAAARGPDEHDEAAVLHLEVDVLQHLDGAEGLSQAFDADFGHWLLT